MIEPKVWHTINIVLIIVQKENPFTKVPHETSTQQLFWHTMLNSAVQCTLMVEYWSFQSAIGCKKIIFFLS